MGKQQR